MDDMKFFFECYNPRINSVLEEHTLLKWREIAHSHDMNLGEYIDGVIRDKIDDDYRRGFITSAERDALKKAWGV